MNIGPRIQALRVAAGFPSVYAAVKATKIPYGVLYATEHDTTSPRLDTLEMLANKFGKQIQIEFVDIEQ